MLLHLAAQLSGLHLFSKEQKAQAIARGSVLFRKAIPAPGPGQPHLEKERICFGFLPGYGNKPS
ncbi:MAG: hypothetical protein QMD09_06085, partial [Desulfatibacillaceae bacterium]|nr:hypothetical protein [Desulfatibacillaceae bacterium]